jgi:predicted nucleic acid-binding protein
MTACFADTFYFFALLNPRDHVHARTRALADTLRRPLVTTTWVLTEVADGLAATPSRALFQPFL